MNKRALNTLDSIRVRSLNKMNILVSETDHPKSVLYFHGFPGPYESLAEGEIRIADQIYDLIESTHNFYYPLYTIKKANFNFDDGLRDGLEAYKCLRNERPNDPLTVIGQSWGAVLALQLVQSVKIEHLILIVPFLFIPSGSSAEQLVRYYSKKVPGLLPPDRMGEFKKQIESLAVKAAPAEMLKKFAGRVTIISAGKDELISIDAVKALACEQNIKLMVLEGQSHAIEDRQMMWDAFRDAFI